MSCCSTCLACSYTGLKSGLGLASGSVTTVVVGTLVILWRGGDLAYWHIGVGTAVALTALLKNIILYRNSLG